MHVEFERLIKGFCTLTGDAFPQQIIDGGSIFIEDVTFRLIYKPTVDPKVLFLYADFGQFDLEDQAALYPLLLQENILMLNSREGTFSVSATQDSVVMIEKMVLSAHTPETLLARLRALTRKVNYFSKQHRGGSIRLRRRFPSVDGLAAQNQPRKQDALLREH